MNCAPLPVVPCVMSTALRTAPFSSFTGFADRPVMDLQFRQRLAGSEFEIADDVIAFRRRRIFGGEAHWPDSAINRAKTRQRIGEIMTQLLTAHFRSASRSGDFPIAGCLFRGD